MELFADFYNGNADGLVNDRFDFLGVRAGRAHADFVTPEYATAPDVEGRAFEVCRGIGHSFGYNAWETDADHLDPDELVRTFVDIVAHGGNLLLNVGPTATGEIATPQARRLDALGWWLRVNGEAIYGTRPAERIEGETACGLPVRATARGATTYAIVQGTPTGRVVELDVRPAAGSRVRRLGDAADADWTPSGHGCRVTLPVPCASSPAVAFRISPG
jgi:alpha-L-fucosidase